MRVFFFDFVSSIDFRPLLWYIVINEAAAIALAVIPRIFKFLKEMPQLWLCRGGYFFFVIFITPKTTTANKLSNNITSLMLTLPPPQRGTT